MSVGLTQGIKRAAVALQELHPEDQQWMLSQLADEKKALVLQALEQLKGLGGEQLLSFDQVLMNEMDENLPLIFISDESSAIVTYLDTLSDDSLLVLQQLFSWEGKDDYCSRRKIANDNALVQPTLAVREALVEKLAGIDKVAHV